MRAKALLSENNVPSNSNCDRLCDDVKLDDRRRRPLDMSGLSGTPPSVVSFSGFGFPFPVLDGSGSGFLSSDSGGLLAQSRKITDKVTRFM